MKIQEINNVNFNARVDKKFVNNTERYFLKRSLGLQYKNFRNHLELMDTYGTQGSEILYKAFPAKNKKMLHALFLKNTKINKKQAYVLALSNRFTDIISFFNNITDTKLLQWEKEL